MRNALLPVLALLLGSPLSIARPPDALDETLALAGLRRADLGWEPKGWWPRYPEVPYKLRAFDSLFREPLDAVAYTRALAEAAREKLDPARLDEKEPERDGALFQAVQRLGIDPKFGGFRGYSANLIAEEAPLEEALLDLLRAAERPTRIRTFGMDLPYPKPAEELARAAAAVPAEVRPILGRLVRNAIDAHRWAELAFRNVDARHRALVATRENIGSETVDAYDYCPEFDDVARVFDEASLWYAAQKCVQALDDARVALAVVDRRSIPDFRFDYESPWGWIRVRGSGDDIVDGDGALLLVDLGGNDTYTGGAAASAADRPLGLLLDMAGDDRYRSEGRPAQGAGMAGVGVLIDAGGNDTYEAERHAQGFGQFGLGLLADLAGNDRYFNRISGQGCGFFGIGLLFDVSGDDEYTLHADGQGLGGPAGVGILADRGGNDRYVAVRSHAVTGRPSYHSPGLDVAVSNAQGCGIGRRGDGSDGHSWAGGLGALLDAEGNDFYSAGNWSMGTGYWFGTGILHDGGGDDEYRGVAWSQGTGAHFCIGVLVDENGDDKHLAEENSTLSLGMGHDFTVAILLDAGGDDLYSVDRTGLGCSLNRSVAMLIDEGGDDVYETKEVPRPGHAENNERFRARGGVGSYFADTSSLGLFLDIGGRDTYWSNLANDSEWLDPPDSPNWEDRNFGVGVDRETGTIDWTPIPRMPPSGAPVPHR
ncbi:MAG: hypothetical protein FJY73_10330 [Candidatus Eisenbacteria bacterium]|nr:hypothetical protein [Candidatus Eisenbacteria bacterium]